MRARVLRALPAVVAFGFAAAGAAVVRTLGLGITRDGGQYLEVAFELASGSPTLGNAAYPLGYSLLVAAAMQVEPFAMDAAALVAQASIFVLLLSAAGLLARASAPLGAAPQALLASLGVAFLATLLPLAELELHALSDAPFGALVALHVYAVARSAEGGRASGAWLALAAAVLGFAIVVRVIGYAPLAVFTLYVAGRALQAWRSERALLERLLSCARLAATHALAWFPFVAIALAHQLAGHRVHGDRGGSRESLSLNLERAAATFPSDLGWPLLALLAFALAAIALRRAPAVRAPFAARHASAHFVVYVVAIVAAATWTKVSPVGSRFFAPYYALALAPLCALPVHVDGRARRGAIAVVAFGLAIGCAANLRQLAFAHAGIGALEADALTYHDRLGFERSRGVPEVRAFLREIAARDGGATMTMIAPLRNGGHHAALARTLLFRRAAFAEPGDDARFDRTDVEHFALRSEGPPPRELRYVDLPIGPDGNLAPESVLAAALEVMVRDRRSALWLLAPRAGDPLEHVRAIVGAPLAIAARREVGPYRAHELALVQETGASVSQ